MDESMTKKKPRKHRDKSRSASLSQSASGARSAVLLEELEQQGEGVDITTLAAFRELQEYPHLMAYLTRRLDRSSRDTFLRLLPVVAAFDDADLNTHLERSLRERDLPLGILRQVPAHLPDGQAALRERIEGWVRQAESLVEAISNQAQREVDAEAEQAVLRDLAQRLRGMPRTYRRSVYEALVDSAEASLQTALLAVGMSDAELAKEMAEWLGAAEGTATAQFAGLMLAAVSQQDKPTGKLVRTAIHRLRSRGFSVDVPDHDEEQGVFRLGHPSVPSGLMTSIDPRGDRLVWLFTPQGVRGISCFVLHVNDGRGIVSCEVHDTTRKGARQLRQYILDEYKVRLHDIAPAYACFLVDEAYALNQATGNSAPEAFALRRSEIDQVRGEVTEPIIYSLVDEDDVRVNPWFLSQSEQLAEELGAKFWFIDDERLASLSTQKQGVEESPIILTNVVQQERQSSFHEDAAQVVYDEVTLRRFKRRLEALAYDLWQDGKHDDAKVAIAAALAFAVEPFDAKAHPFAREALRLGLELVKDERKEEDAGQLIITPEMARRQLRSQERGGWPGAPAPTPQRWR